MIYKLCAKCGKTVEYPKRYCDKCQEIVDKQNEGYKRARNRRYDKKRDPVLVRFRKSKEWKELKNKYLSDLQNKYGDARYAYRCEDCIEEHKKNPAYTIRLAEEVHHLIPIETPEGYKRRLDYNNLRALCHYHHDKRHNRFQSRKENNKM